MEILKILSKPRFERYLSACNQNEQNALELYRLNLLICRSFYPLLSIFEVSLRNALDEVLSQHFNDKNWILNQRSKFMSHEKLKPHFIAKRQVDEAEKQLLHRRKNVNRQLITELTLAFWVRLFQADHFATLKAEPIKIFKKIPSNTKRDRVHEILKGILDFRNRIYHNEPICFGKDEKSQSVIIDMRQIQDVIQFFEIFFHWLGGERLTALVQYQAEIVALHHKIDDLNTLIHKIGKGIPMAYIKH